MQYCKCHQTLSFKEAMAGLIDEAKEYVEEPSMDEFSDITYSLNRLLGAMTKRPYVKFFPLTKMHVDKINERMQSHGCIRSKRHLIDGKCPSE